MVARPTWRGHLKLSLVTCPVALYTATSSAGDVHFNLINPATINRIKLVTTDPDTGPVNRGDLVKGYEVEKSQYVLLSTEEIAAVRLESTKTLDIERFVPEAEIDRAYWEQPYFLAPDGKVGQEAYAVIREAMRSSGQIALGRVVLSTRERLVALEPHGKGIMAFSLRTKGEVKSSGDAFGEVEEVAPDKGMIDTATAIIRQQAGPFDPTQFNDRCEAPPVQDTNVIDLMAALRASLTRGAAPAAAKAQPGAVKPAVRRGAKAEEPAPPKAAEQDGLKSRRPSTTSRRASHKEARR